ncbi:MAG: lipopolysaccharide heptosyltransferase family protein [Gemmatimonadetes bacterium]|nr:lipopolysaccharide heptosyltransferase family protein [Gemmatimonadota bacterium]
MKENIQQPRTVCIVMLSALGDAVHVLPVVNALKLRWPETHITWVTQPLSHQLVQGHRSVDRFLLFERRRGLGAWESYHELARGLPERPFDLVLALQVYLKAGLITGLVRGRTKLGFDHTRARDLNWLFTNEKIEFHGERHVQDQYFEFLEHLGIDPHPAVWDIPISGEERAAQQIFFGQLDRPACAVVIGTTKPEKNWHAEGYARVLEGLESEHGLQPILVGGPSRAEREMADRILGLTRARPLDLLGDDLRRLVWLLDGSALVISPDTGPLHIARALDVPVVGLYGYTNPKRTGPYRRYQDLVVDGYAEFPGEAYPVTPTHRDGMKRVTVEAVKEKISLARVRYLR